MDTKAKSLRKPIIITAVCLLVLLLPLVYFFGWRASDNDYLVVSGSADYLNRVNKIITVELSSLKKPGHINTATPIKVEALSKSYAEALRLIKDSPATNRDLNLSATYNKHKVALEQYSQSLNDLSESLKLYTSALNSCKEATDNLITGYNEEAFDALLKACLSNLKKAESAKSKPFNDSFLREYVSETTAYMTSVQKMVDAPDNNATDTASKEAEGTYDKINKLGEVELKLELPSIAAALRDISSTAESQKKAFLR